MNAQASLAGSRKRQLSDSPLPGPDSCNKKARTSLPETSGRENSFRVFTWNVNGISAFLQTSITSFFPSSTKQSAHPSASLRSFLVRHNYPQVLFLQEVKINPSDRRTQAAVKTAVNARLGDEDCGPDYTVHFTLPKDRYNAKGFGGKVYGVCSIIAENFYQEHVDKVRDVDWDLEGRVNVVELKDRMALWNVYAVNGTDNPYRDSQTGLVIGTRHDKKRHFHRHLTQECLDMEANGWSHIIAGDLNVAPARIDGHPNLRTRPEAHVINRADFRSSFLDAGNEEGLRAVDVWRELHPEHKSFTYYSRNVAWGSSCDRVDLILSSRSLWEAGKILAAEILDTVQERGPSDHVPLFVELALRNG